MCQTTEEIIRQLKRAASLEGNFRLLFERYYGRVYRFFRRKGISPEDSRDLTQETFLAVYEGLKDLNQESYFEVWLYRIALNGYRNEIERRRAKKRAGGHASFEEEESSMDRLPASRGVADSAAGPLDVVLEKERKEKLREALQSLPQQMRRCVHLRVAKELSTREIAAIMCISVNTVKAHLYQAQQALKVRLSPYFGEVDLRKASDE